MFRSLPAVDRLLLNMCELIETEDEMERILGEALAIVANLYRFHGLHANQFWVLLTFIRR